MCSFKKSLIVISILLGSIWIVTSHNDNPNIISNGESTSLDSKNAESFTTYENSRNISDWYKGDKPVIFLNDRNLVY